MSNKGNKEGRTAKTGIERLGKVCGINQRKNCEKININDLGSQVTGELANVEGVAAAEYQMANHVKDFLIDIGVYQSKDETKIM